MGDKRKPSIGLLINQIEGRYQSLIRQGLSDFTNEHHIHLKTFVGRSLGSPYDNEDMCNTIYSLAAGVGQEAPPDGLVVTAGSIGSFLDPARIQEFLARFAPVPLITIGMHVEGYPCVSTDNTGGITQLVDHLFKMHGYTRFAFLKGSRHSPEARARFSAWNDALTHRGIPERERLVYEGDFSYRSGSEIACALAQEDSLPFEVISCANDDMALGLVQTLATHGIVCPRDYAVTGFDDIPDAGFLSPRLTTIHQPLYAQAVAAGRQLLNMIAVGESAEPPLPLTTALVIRDSCGCTDIPLVQGRKTSDTTEGGVSAHTVRKRIGETLPAAMGLFSPAADEAIEAAGNLCDALYLDMRKFSERPLFLQTLSNWFDATARWDEYSNRWHILLSVVRSEIRSGLSDVRSREYMDELFTRAFSMQAQKTGEQHARSLSTLRNTLALFRDLSLSLANTRNKEDLCAFVSRHAHALGFTRVVIVLHSRGPIPVNGNPLGINWSEIDQHVCIEGKPENESVRLPLAGRKHSFGYIELEGVALDPLVYESLRDQVSQALESLYTQTAREEAERALQKSEEKFRDIASALPVLIIETDAGFGITYANRRAQDCLNITDTQARESLKRYIGGTEAAYAAVLKRLDTEREIDSPALHFVRAQSRQYIPVLRISGKYDDEGILTALRWTALDPLDFVGKAVLPDREFWNRYHITSREQEIIDLQIQGLRIKDIAERLFIAESTVKGHVTQIYNKLGIAGRGELFRLIEDEQVSHFGHDTYLFSLLNRLLSREPERHQ